MSDILTETTAPLTETAAPAPTESATTVPPESAQESTPQPTAAPVDSAPTPDAEHYGLRYLHKMLHWLKSEFEALGLDIKAELEKL